MLVCQIISSFRPIIGGAERATENLAKALIDRGVSVVVVTRRYSPEHAAFEIIDGIAVHRVGLPGRSKFHALSFSIAAIILLATRLRAYHIIHSQNIDAPLLVGMVAALLLRRRLVVTIHGETQLIGRRSSRTGRSRIRAMVRAADLFTSINPENTRELLRAGVSPARIREIPNGVDTKVLRPPTPDERDSARARLRIPDEAFVVLYLGRLQSVKRVDLLIEAWADANRGGTGLLVIVGAGPEADRLRGLAGSERVDIRFDGPTDDALSYLQAADVFANASGDPRAAWQEGLSVALLEAMSVGVMPIVTRGPGNDVLVHDGTTGLSVPMGDRGALAASLRTAMDDPDLRARLGHAARASIQERYAASTVAAEAEAAYRSVSDRA